MLGDYPVDVMLLATDLGVARRFYEGTLGLAVLVEDEQFLTFRCGGDSRLVVTKSTAGTADTATKASWRVADLAAEVAELRARGGDGVRLFDQLGPERIELERTRAIQTPGATHLRFTVAKRGR